MAKQQPQRFPDAPPKVGLSSSPAPAEDSKLPAGLKELPQAEEGEELIYKQTRLLNALAAAEHGSAEQTRLLNELANL